MSQTSIWDALEGKYGKQIASPLDDKLSQFMFYMILYAERPAVATKVVNFLGGKVPEYFCGWNEARVASIRELSDALEQCGIKDNQRRFLAGKAIKHMLQQVWEAFDDVDIELVGAEPRYVETFMDTIKWPLVKNYILCLWGKTKQVPMDPHTDRIAERLGLYTDKTSKKEKLKVLSEVFKNEEIAKKHRLLVMLGKTTCIEGSPQCGRCALQDRCKFAKANAAAKSA